MTRADVFVAACEGRISWHGAASILHVNVAKLKDLQQRYGREGIQQYDNFERLVERRRTRLECIRWRHQMLKAAQ